jgi:hypothetical protein
MFSQQLWHIPQHHISIWDISHMTIQGFDNLPTNKVCTFSFLYDTSNFSTRPILAVLDSGLGLVVHSLVFYHSIINTTQTLKIASADNEF